MQPREEVAPVPEVDFPSGQVEQTSLTGDVEYVPLAQSVQAWPSILLPAGHVAEIGY